MRAFWLFVARHIAVEYFLSVRLNNLLQAKSEIISLKRLSLTFLERILNAYR
ncbi:MAG: hypothetical protein ACTXOO_04150 [Sodalis sp. (in: enterobacteria)]